MATAQRPVLLPPATPAPRLRATSWPAPAWGGERPPLRFRRFDRRVRCPWHPRRPLPTFFKVRSRSTVRKKSTEARGHRAHPSPSRCATPGRILLLLRRITRPSAAHSEGTWGSLAQGTRPRANTRPILPWGEAHLATSHAPLPLPSLRRYDSRHRARRCTSDSLLAHPGGGWRVDGRHLAEQGGYGPVSSAQGHGAW